MGIQPWKKKKKSLAQEARQKSDISEHEVRAEGRFVPFNPYFVRNTAIVSLCDDFYRKNYDFTIKNR